MTTQLNYRGVKYNELKTQKCQQHGCSEMPLEMLYRLYEDDGRSTIRSYSETTECS